MLAWWPTVWSNHWAIALRKKVTTLTIPMRVCKWFVLIQLVITSTTRWASTNSTIVIAPIKK
jgi:hypothetical protein